MHRFDVIPQVINAVGIVEETVFGADIVRPETVLHHHQRDFVPAVDIVEIDAESERIDLPSPVTGLQIRILHAGDHIAAGFLQDIGIRRAGAAHVVGKGIEVYGSFLQNLIISRFLAHCDAVILEIAFSVVGIVSPDLYITAEVVAHIHGILGFLDISGVAGVGIHLCTRNHTADAEFRIDAVTQDDGKRAGHKLVMESREAVGGFFRCFLGFEHRLPVFSLHAQAENPAHRHGRNIDLIEGQPVLDFILVFRKQGLCVVHPVVDDIPSGPAVVDFGQPPGEFIMGHRYQRFNAVLPALSKDFMIEIQSLPVGFLLHAGREDPGPVDGETEALEAHFSVQGNILGIAVIEVHSFMGRVVYAVLDFHIPETRRTDGSSPDMIRNGRSFSIFVPCTFELVRCCGASPQESFLEAH